MNPTKHSLLAVASLVILCSASLGTAQTLQEMEVIDQGMAMVVVRNPEDAILIVTSVIPKLSFASNMGIIRVDDRVPGEWIVYLHPGTNLITFMAEGYKSVSQRLVVPKKRARKVEVKPLITRGTLIVESGPPGAAIFLEGEDTEQQTPYEFEGQETRTYQLVLKMTHYRADTTTVEVKAGEITRITRSLQAVGYLTVHTVPSEADVVLDSGTEEVITVRTPVEMFALKTGVYSLSVYKPGYLGWKLSVTIEKGKIVQRELDLKRVEDLVSTSGKLVRPRPFYKKWWFWTALAGGSIAVWRTQQEGAKDPRTGKIGINEKWSDWDE